MNNPDRSLQETTVPNSKAAQQPATQKKYDPIRIFVDKDRLARFWFIALVCVLAVSALDRYCLVNNLKQRERVVIIDPAGTYYVSPLLKFDEAKDLHAQLSALATLALLERNPHGFDHDDLVKQMYLAAASQKAQALRGSEQVEFAGKQLHQKPEIGRIDILNTREQVVLTQVSGQLIRTGIFLEKPFTESIPFKLSFRLQRNPDMVRNGRFPAAVADFKYEPEPTVTP